MDKINGRTDVKTWFYRYFDKIKGHEQKKCFYCGSDKVQKYGHVNGVQRYRCWACGRQFLGGNRIDSATLWREYSELKQTYAQLAEKYGCSPRTIKRKLDAYTPPKGLSAPGRAVFAVCRQNMRTAAGWHRNSRFRWKMSSRKPCASSMKD